MTNLVPESETPNKRERAKADRRDQLLQAAARLVAMRGYARVRLEDLGSAVGISGPAIYRHFPNKEALLVDLLTDVSRRLLAGGTDVVEAAAGASEALSGLIDFHLDFALNESDLIRVQDRDLDSLPENARRQVRQYQRRYVEAWVQVLCQIDGELDESDARIKAHAAFGLMNSTPYSAGRSAPTQTRAVLRQMVVAALGS
ncbi:MULTISPECIES: SACE_7040 family transcriptional regulator [Mycobacteroides]|jgi:AcrR family transcriptional regulator|uniref:TetR family transcriptional regulator n=1 Tax=Mycobacteroides chelonae TaxID=1774 RepID=A0A1S1M910_MYCCH|nr:MULTISPECIES: TetR/AcrR family transcriptional regulator [Mycobacteroides]AMW22069.1 TetR family transcriptional regulator [Mycobacterium sp. QIA-37]PKQ57763.1 TetR family transcriptional regulator [Mycobacterium sp. MHSD3]SKL41027.1 Putative transcriptional regulator, TetR family [Mycobacteroides abscessus subsp. bolletii]KRQ19043.1 TetR family transcriptional regulator [Mycobacteroides sp. H003]KRQ28969.1 TetR family transcriptional regulator [Mycobacteroides sp. H072]